MHHTHINLSLLLFTAFALTACGGANDGQPLVLEDPDENNMMQADMSQKMQEEDMQAMMEEVCPIEDDSKPGLYGSLYMDTNFSSKTARFQSIDEMDTPLEGLGVKLLRSDASLETVSCADGRFFFPEPKGGWYALDVDAKDPLFATSSNQTRRFAAAVAEGKVKILTFGDSVPAYGPQPWFPKRTKDFLDTITQAENVNVAIPGSTSVEWLPGGAYFDSRLGKDLASADVIVFSLGGNDLFALATANPNTTPLNEIVEQFNSKVAEIKVNIKTILSELRKQNPTADIVWVVYPNYARSTAWKNRVGSAIGFIQTQINKTLFEIRDEVAHHEGVLLLDIYEATSELNLDEILYDELHFNDKGHEFFARELLRTLGAVEIGINGKAALEEDVLIGFGDSTKLMTPANGQ